MAEVLEQPVETKKETLNNAISKALESEQPLTEGTKEESSVNKDTGKDESSSSSSSSSKESKESKEEESKKEELTAEESKQALDLWKALKNPESAPTVVAFLAEKAGYTKKEIQNIDTTKKAEEVKDEVLELFTEQFGADFAAKILPAFNKIIDKKVQENTKTLEAKFTANEIKELEKESASTLNSLSKEYLGLEIFPDNVAKEMSKVMDRIPASPGSTMKDYLEDIYLVAAGRLGINTKKIIASGKSSSSNEDKLKKNRNDVGERISSSGHSPIPGTETPNNRVAQFPSLKAAIEAAIENESKG